MNDFLNKGEIRGRRDSRARTNRLGARHDFDDSEPARKQAGKRGHSRLGEMHADDLVEADPILGTAHSLKFR